MLSPSRISLFERFEASIEIFDYQNGLKSVHVPGNDQSFMIGVIVGVGARNEDPAVLGISHFLEHIMFRGSKKYPSFLELSHEFEMLGGEWNAATGYDTTEFWYSGVKRHAIKTMELFCEFITEPRFQDFEIERSIIKREIEGELNEFGNSLDLDYHLNGLFWPGSVIDRQILGTMESVNSLKLTDIESHYRNFYQPKNMLFYTVGSDQLETQTRETPISPEFVTHCQRVFKKVDASLARDTASVASFSSDALAPNLSSGTGLKIKAVENTDNELEVLIGFKAPPLWHPDSLTCEIVASLLADGFSAILCREIREKLGLVYSIDCHFEQQNQAGSLSVTATIKPEDCRRFFNELVNQLKKLKEKGPQQKDFTRVVERASVDLELIMGDPHEWVSEFSWAHMCGKTDSLSEELKRLAELTAEQVKGMVDELFQHERAAVVVLGPAAESHVESIKSEMYRI